MFYIFFNPKKKIKFNSDVHKNAAFPEILASDLKDQSVYESCPVSFEIIAQGIPKLDAQWTLNDKPLKADEHFDITEDGLKYKLSIADVKLTDAGQFKVVVKNKLGELSKECKLNVMRKYIDKSMCFSLNEMSTVMQIFFFWFLSIKLLPNIANQF